MLYADKNALRTQLKVNMLRIRERELQYYTNNCLSISTSAALLAGFAWYGLTEVPFDQNANIYTQVERCDSNSSGLRSPKAAAAARRHKLRALALSRDELASNTCRRCTSS